MNVWLNVIFGGGRRDWAYQCGFKKPFNANLFPDFSEIAFLLKPCFHPIEEAGYVMFQLFFANFDGFTYNAECI